MSDNKTYSLNLSAQMILGIILSVLVPIGGAVYYGITLFNDLTSTIEEVKKMSSVETRIVVLEDRSKSTERQLVDVMMSNNRALEKANEAYGRAIEANSVAKSTADKITDTVTNVKDEMKQLRKAMVNPLNN
jgi:DNA-binding helix-hairpin-helix protein with protein kinase domain